MLSSCWVWWSSVVMEFFFFFFISVSASRAFTNMNTRRSIFINSPMVRQEVAITARRNTDTNTPYIVVIPKGWNISYLKAVLIADGRELVSRQINTKDCPSEHDCYAIDNLPTRDKMVDFVVAMTMTDLLQVTSKATTQFDPLMVKMQVNSYLETIYETERETIIFAVDKEFKMINLNCASPYNKEPEIRSDLPNVLQFTCGPYGRDNNREGKNAFSINFNLRHYPFLRIDNMEKIITLVPLLNKVKVMERYDLNHIGFKVERFSRFELMKAMIQRRSDTQIVINFPIIIPKEAIDIELRDELGILHTGWNRRSHDKFDVIESLPRFPLAGGWKAAIILNYNIPINSFVKAGSIYKSMTFPFITFALDINVANYRLEVNLPEDASDISYRYPLLQKIQAINQSRYRTYLSSRGEQRIEFIAKNITKEYESFITIAFKLSWWSILRKPIVALVILLIFYQGSRWSKKKRVAMAPIYAVDISFDEKEKKIKSQ